MPRAVVIDWVDSSGGDASWTYYDGYDATISMCQSVGFVLHETDEFIAISGTICYDRPLENIQQYHGDIIIPKCAIKEINEFDITL